MNKVLAAAAALSMTASVAFAGGPVVIVEEGEPEVIVTEPGTSGGGIVLALLGLAVLAAVAGGDGT